MKSKVGRQVKEHRAAYSTRKSNAPRVLPFPQAKHLARKERLALKAYQDYLFEKLPDQIERIVLFGSKARGDSATESDLDVLVVVTGNEGAPESFESRRKELGDGAYDLDSKYGVYISPIVEPLDQVQKWTPLLEHIHQDGIELWRKPGTQETDWPPQGEVAMAMSKQEHIEARVAMAQEKLRAAKKMLESDLYNDTISCAYYAMFYASKALLLALGEDPHKHEGVVSLYGERIAKVGMSDPKYGELLRQAKNLRIRADYEDFFHATRQQSEDAIKNAEDFVNQAQETLKKIQTRGE